MYDVLNNGDLVKNFKAHPIIYNINKSTGKISKVFDLLYGDFGFCFSPNSKLFYVFGIERNNSSYIYQYDITQADPNSSVKRIMVGDYNIRSLQLGPDSIIYVNYENSKTVGAIYFPDSILHSNYSNNCGYVKNAVYLDDSFNQSSHSGWFFPNFIDSRSLSESEIPLDFTIKIMNCDSIELCAPFYKNKTYDWYFEGSSFNIHKRKISFTCSPFHYTYHVSLKVPGIDSIYKEFTVDTLPDFKIKPEMINCQKGLYDKFSIVKTTDLSKYNFIWSVDSNGMITENYDTMIIVNWNPNSVNLNVHLNVSDFETGCIKNFTYTYIFNRTYARGHIFNYKSPSHPFPVVYLPRGEQVFVLGGNIVIKDNADIYFPEVPDKVYMKKCANIIVDSASTLNIINSDIFGCNNWSGITAIGRQFLDGTILKIKKSKISDANVAVYAEDNAFVDIDSSEFKNNLTHIAMLASPMSLEFINHNTFSGFFKDSNVCINPYWYYSYSGIDTLVPIPVGQIIHFDPSEEMIHFDSIFSISISNNIFSRFKNNNLLYSAIIGRKINNFQIINDTFLGTFSNIINIAKKFSQPPFPQNPGDITDNYFNVRANNGIKINDFNSTYGGINTVNIVQNKIIGKIDTAININNSAIVGIQSDTLINTLPLREMSGLYFKNSSIVMNHSSILGYNYGIQYYDTSNYSFGNPSGNNGSISECLIDSNRIGLVIADSVNPETSINSTPYNTKNLTIACNKFYDNAIGILGSGGLIDQGDNNHDAANDFYNCSDWNMLWKNSTKISYFFNQSYSNRTNPLFITNGPSYNIDGIMVNVSDVDTFGVFPANSCFGVWIFISALNINTESNQNITIYPNPFDNELLIKNNGELKYLKIEIFDIIGNIIFDHQINNSLTIINTDSWNSSVYLLKITDSNKALIYKKLIKTK